MNESDWEATAKQLAKDHASRITKRMIQQAEGTGLGCPQPSDLRRALVEVDQLLRQAPTPIQQRYKRISEATLRSFSSDVVENFDQGSLVWLELSDMVLAAGAQARGLDEFLFQHGDARGKPTDASRDFLCELTRTHVIPRPNAKPPAVSEIRTLTYERRGLVRHRLLPEEIEGYTIELCWFRDLSLSYRKKDAKVVGAVFDGLLLERDQGFENFVAHAAPCNEEASTLAAQVASAFAGDVTVAAWPELTMPPNRLDALAALLAAQAKIKPPGNGPTIVVAGSWHKIEGGKVYNRMPVLSGAGIYRFSHTKSLPMESRDLGVEEIVPSYRIPVLIAEDALISFAICRDFCEGQISTVYSFLDVDLIVVPSYGDAKTFEEHCHKAYSLSRGPGVRTFVVQQVVPQEVAASGAGYILSPNINAGRVSIKELITKSPGETYPISYKKV